MANGNDQQNGTSLTEEQVRELLPGYILDALEPEEMLAVDAYLQAQAGLLERVEALEAAAAHLALAAPPVEVPVEARGALLARVQADARARWVSEAPEELSSSERHTQPPEAASISWERRLAGWLRPRAWQMLTAGAVAALILVAVYAGQLARELAVTRESLAQIQQEVASLRETNADLRQQLQANRNQFAIMAAPREYAVLSGTEDAPEASGAFYFDKDRGLLVLRGLPPLPPDRTYELWLTPDSAAPVPAGLLSVADREANTFLIDIPPGAQDFVRVGISVEPAGGTPAPTGPRVLLGTTD